MSATVTTGTGAEATGEGGKLPPRVLRGMAWLVWRQHRVVLLACLLLTAAAAVNMLWQRASMMDFLAQARTGGTAFDVTNSFQNSSYASAFQDGAWVMGMLPLAAGVFLGAPLIAGDLERGTLKLVTTQSMTRRHWLTVKIGTVVFVTLLCSVVLSAVYTWWWRPARSLVGFGEWTNSPVFDSTGPMPVAMALLYLAVGIAAGVLVRRVLPAMAITFGLGTFVFGFLWDRVRLLLFTPRVITNPVEQGQPHVPEGGARFDNWTVDAHGGLHGFGTCFNEHTPAECRTNKGIVAERLEYFGSDQMSVMQWVDAALLLTAAVAVAGLTLWWVRRRSL
ncbi:ABC transporter permease [Streptomyces sp. UNOC14_S4]|uniref:ABC transporter permease n=1 Tax=Streptomyces sp. UNOC14_S4 TaxID=2872340 RepID=UPI001E52E388|nr:ABC transporter permease [Streptomyces sp. UNOC14_S4]MCC3772857.1 ABC transporter permease [Streptomyces sp. UNOC14_S4]